MEASDAIKLFSARLRHTNLMATPGHDELLAIYRICRAVSGFPLAIELAAGAGFGDLVDRAQALETDATVLTTPLSDIRERHRSVQAAFEHSWQQLSDAEQAVLKQLAIFQGGFDLEAAQAVTDANEVQLQAFTDKALLKKEDGRYGFHALIQQYLRKKLVQRPELEQAVRERHGRYYSHILSELNLAASGGASPELLRFMGREEGNLQAYIAWALETKHYGELSALAEPLLWHYPVRGRFQEGLALCEQIIAALRQGGVAAYPVLSAFLTSYGWIRHFMGDIGEALVVTEEARLLADQAQDTLQMLRARDGLGQAHTRSGQADLGIKHLSDALKFARSFEDPVRLLRILTNLGQSYCGLGKPKHGLEIFSEAVDLYRQGRAPPSMDVVSFLLGLGITHMLSADYVSALETYGEGLVMAEAIDSPGQQPVIQALMAISELERVLTDGSGDLQTAAERATHVLTVTRATGESMAHAVALTTLARCRLEQRDLDVLALLDEAYRKTWQGRDLISFIWTLPYAVDAALALRNIRVAGVLLGFVNTHLSTQAWVCRRCDQAVAKWQGTARDVELLRNARAQGQSMTFAELGSFLLAFTGQSQIS